MLQKPQAVVVAAVALVEVGILVELAFWRSQSSEGAAVDLGLLY
jgi:hypothetical protein